MALHFPQPLRREATWRVLFSKAAPIGKH